VVYSVFHSQALSPPKEEKVMPRAELENSPKLNLRSLSETENPGYGKLLESGPGKPSEPSSSSATDRTEHYAGHLKDSAAALFLFAGMKNLLKDVDLESYRRFRDRLLHDYGSPTDPITIMLVEQIVMAHMNIGLLYYKASTAGSVECSSSYLAAAARLLGELRRTALALPLYIEGALRLKQGEAQVEESSEKNRSDSELDKSGKVVGESQEARGIGKPAGSSRVTA
jgi:hypothetical protein